MLQFLDPTVDLQTDANEQDVSSSQQSSLSSNHTNGDGTQGQPILAKKFQSLSTASIVKSSPNGGHVKQFAGHGSIELDLDI